MAKIIKFRGKAVVDGSWVYGDLVHTSSNEMAIWPTETCHNGAGMIEVMPTSVGQYTNSRDCNDKEIYEGDIVRQKWETSLMDEHFGKSFLADGVQTGIVKLGTRGIYMSPCLCQRSNSNSATLTKNVPVTGRRSEVIGNISDYPSLFEVICNS